MSMHWMRPWLLALWPVAACAGAADDPAAHQVQMLDESLLKSMRAGSTLTITDRYRLLQPVIQSAFDLPMMSRLSVGSAWTTFSAEQQQAVVAAFTRLTIAGYAHNFQAFGGEEFILDDNIVTRGEDKIVQTRIRTGHDTSATVVYRTRQLGGNWKIIDVFYDGISQLTMRRSDFGAAIAAGGASALIAHLNSLSDGYLAR